MINHRSSAIAVLLGLALLLSACTTAPGEKQDRAEDLARAEAIRNLGEAYLREGNTAAALREFKKAEALTPDDYFLHYDLGLAYLSKKRYDLAIEHFQKAVDLNPDYAPAVNSLGNAYAARGDWDQAIKYYKQVSANVFYATPHYPLSNLGLAYYHKQEYTLSERYYQEALEIQPNFVNALAGLAQTYDAVGRFPEAVSLLEKAVRADPDSALLRFQLGKSYARAGDRQRAYASFSKVIDMSPNSGLAQDARREIENLR
jgi:Tfp pilus assembly protein PilF